MLDKEQSSQNSSQGDVFIELTDALRASDDAGMTAFEAHLREIQTYLVEDFIVPHETISHKELTSIDHDLNEDWPHKSDIAQVSGRIYLYDSEAEESVPSEWGEGLVDKDDMTYYLVEGQYLRSVGVETIPEYDDEDEVVGIKMAYLFASPDDDDETPVYCAYLDELYEHCYNRPTLQEAVTRLENEWPRQLAFIQEWLRPDIGVPLPQRLQYITKELQDDLIHSEQFRVYCERYIEDFISLDQTMPYHVTTQGALEYFDGTSDPYSDGNKGEWHVYAIDGELSIYGHKPKVTISKNDDETVRFTLLVSVFNAEDGDDAEYIRLDINGVRSLRSTRALQSLLSSAIYDSFDGSIIEGVPVSDNSRYDSADESREALLRFSPSYEEVGETTPRAH